MLDYRKTRAWTSGEVTHHYTAKDTILYALGLGFGRDPLDERELRFVYEKHLVALPSMAAVLATPGFWIRDRKELGIDATKLVHGEQAMRLHAPLPAEGSVIGTTRVTRVVDKGAGKGAVIEAEKLLIDAATRRPIATVESVYFCRGDGGFSAEQDGSGDEPGPAAAPLPESAPEHTIDIATRPDQALLYRLSGDINPLHADPAVAAKAGFAKPILHGLATWGIACRGVLALFADLDASRLTALRARFSAPVYPGETIRLACWKKADDGEIAFRASVVERDVVVLNHGRATLAT